jgi:hypothetical protein
LWMQPRTGMSACATKSGTEVPSLQRLGAEMFFCFIDGKFAPLARSKQLFLSDAK